MKKILKTYGAVVLICVGVAFASLGLKAALFPVGVASTALTSANGVVKRTLNADNVIANYEWFYDTNAQVESRLGQIQGHANLLKTETDHQERSRLNMELSAMRQSCRDMVTKYNANSEKANRSLFKSRGLPESLSINTCEV